MTRQVVTPRIRGFISMTAHPEGCAANVAQQIEVARKGGSGEGLGNVLVLGCSTGYGLASLLSACFGYGAAALGVCFEKPADAKRTATAGWYNLAAAGQAAREQDRQLEVINGDAFSHAIKAEVVQALKERFGKLDLIVYSLASPRRQDPDSETVYSSTLKPIGAPYCGKTIDLRSDQISEVCIDPASADEIEGTVKVMGGEDWRLWIELLQREGLLADGCRTVAYSYIGPQITYPIYRSGTIGRAKEDLEKTAKELDVRLQEACGGHAWVSVNKALVTQASAAIPVVPLYISVLFKLMKEAGSHEDAAQQIARLYAEHIGPGAEPQLDEEGRIRLDDRELAPAIQGRVNKIWEEIDSERLHELSDYAGFKADFERLFGFGIPGVDYEAETETERPLD